MRISAGRTHTLVVATPSKCSCASRMPNRSKRCGAPRQMAALSLRPARSRLFDRFQTKVNCSFARSGTRAKRLMASSTLATFQKFGKRFRAPAVGLRSAQNSRRCSRKHNRIRSQRHSHSHSHRRNSRRTRCPFLALIRPANFFISVSPPSPAASHRTTAPSCSAGLRSRGASPPIDPRRRCRRRCTA
jgi:hypothetical protein